MMSAARLDLVEADVGAVRAFNLLIESQMFEP